MADERKNHSLRKIQRVPVKIFHGLSREEFLSDVYSKREPAVLRGLDIGAAVTKWTPKYLAEVGGEKLVKVHVCSEKGMDFINKNFVYKTLPFNQFVMRASHSTQTDPFLAPEERYYLRSLGDDPRKDISDIEEHFPNLARDLQVPEFYPKEQFFSSVFRIASAGSQLWTHYDIMDNLLIQVKGCKRAVLFSPKDAKNLYLNGDKSDVLDIDCPDPAKYPRFYSAVQHEALLEPGDVLFIPALWFHNVVSLDFGVAVNVFWRHLPAEMYDNKDVYGNKDLLPATRAMQIVDRAVKLLQELPDGYKDFYARRIICKLEQRCYSNNGA
ncbi:tRNA wybutosine-synthesizing protein 5 isoform X1 [Nematostella vectensis]|uniref:tRNA wybutosine-synthesizing protein 5 isoform X1 n=1 Tax=Nematostella vectensis TaxID=45351 RepID=UPI0020772101|nr:tRNA wybutosine-synthesizing protein 5 isoform X1 [Nematostella vectensis]